jgi:hypothetical protein
MEAFFFFLAMLYVMGTSWEPRPPYFGRSCQLNTAQLSSAQAAFFKVFFKVVVASASNYAACFSNASSRSGFNITVPIGSQLRV